MTQHERMNGWLNARWHISREIRVGNAAICMHTEKQPLPLIGLHTLGHVTYKKVSSSFAGELAGWWSKWLAAAAPEPSNH